MNTSVKKILRRWESSLERFGKIDNWKIDDNLSLLGNYLINKDDSNEIRRLVRQIRDTAICPTYDSEVLLNKIKKIFSYLDTATVMPICLMMKKHNERIKKEGLVTRFKSETKRIFEERLRFKNGMLLRNFDIETECAQDSRKVRRIIEKRMCQAYHKNNRKAQKEIPSNKERYWMQRATAFQLYNIGQVENIKNVSRGIFTHWKKMFDPQTGEMVFKKKMAYTTLERAIEAIEKWKIDYPNDRREVHAYKCAICKKWHIGHYSTVMEGAMLKNLYDFAC